MRVKSTVLPKDLFLVRDAQGNFHWYNSDPLKLTDRATAEVNVEEAIAEVVGWGDDANPVMVNIRAAKINRSEEFNTSLLTGIRKGVEDKHIADLTGSVVDISEYQNVSKEFPLSGIVFSRSGEPLSMRLYNFRGECSDGEPSHQLIVMSGPAVFVSENKE